MGRVRNMRMSSVLVFVFLQFLVPLTIGSATPKIVSVGITLPEEIVGSTQEDQTEENEKCIDLLNQARRYRSSTCTLGDEIRPNCFRTVTCPSVCTAADNKEYEPNYDFEWISGNEKCRCVAEDWLYAFALPPPPPGAPDLPPITECKPNGCKRGNKVLAEGESYEQGSKICRCKKGANRMIQDYSPSDFHIECKTKEEQEQEQEEYEQMKNKMNRQYD